MIGTWLRQHNANAIVETGKGLGGAAVGDARYFSLRFLTTRRQRWRELNRVCYVVEMTSFKSAQDLLLVVVQEGLLDEEEFLLLHDLNTSSNAEY